jgi:glycosyltransferase involved in cell wall biosynthesis
MRVGMFADSFLPQRNGLVRFLCHLTEELLERGIDVCIFVPGERNEMEKFGNAKVCRIRSSPFPFYPGYRVALWDTFRIPFLLRKMKVDIFHIHDPLPIGISGLERAKRKKRPAIANFHVHFVEYLPHLGRVKFLRKAIKLATQEFTWNFLKVFYNYCDATIVPTLEIKEMLARREFRKLIHIPNGIDIKKFSKEFDKEEIRRVLGVPKEKKLILYVGRISLEKKIEVLLKAYSMIEREDTLLYVVGSGPQLEEYKSLARSFRIKNVTFWGGVPDNLLLPLYYASDLFVCPSDTETFGVVFLEAMACGLPLIGADAAGAKEIVIEGKNGLRFKPNSARSLAMKLRRLLKDERVRKRMSKNSREIVKGYSIEKIARRYINLYSLLLEGAP